MPNRPKSFFDRLLTVLGSRVVYTLLSLVIIALGSYFAIQYARGSWRVTKNGIVANTGLLNANSFPQGASVFIDNRLITATDDTIYIEPDVYQVRIVKEGYSPWLKELTIQSELVTQTNALLFPVAPSISPLTLTGVENIHPSPDGQKVLFFTDQASTEAKNGFYILDLNTNFLSLQSGPKQITTDVPSLNLAVADVIWSPDSTEVMILTDQKEFLVPVNRLTTLTSQNDIRFQRKEILASWEEEIYLRERQFLAKFPPEVLEVATTSAKNVYMSPDKKRLLYTATASATLAENLIPSLPAASTQPESRQLEPGAIYVYDREEDKNFQVATVTTLPDLLQNSGQTEQTGADSASEAASLSVEKYLLTDDALSPTAKSLDASAAAFYRLQKTNNSTTAWTFGNYHTGVRLNTMQWFPNSRHLLFIEDNKIRVMEYDGHNRTTIYSGPFANNFVYPWPDGSKLIIQTSFSPDSPSNLYVIDLK